MSFPRVWSVALWLLLTSACFASTGLARPGSWEKQSSLFNREQQFGQWAVRNSKFSEVLHVSSRASCRATAFPEPIATPNPLLDHGTQSNKISVSFIIGTDGRVQSPFILEGADGAEGGNALHTVRTWRYRPATCNGVPAESEATIEFSIR